MTKARTQQSLDAERRFMARLVEMNAVMAEGAIYVGTHTKVALVCAAGHTSNSNPGDVLQGDGICKSCGKYDQTAGPFFLAAKAAFMANVAAIGASLIHGAAYQGKDTPVQITCAAGHECSAIPSSLREGKNPCGRCTGHDGVVAEARFWVIMAKLGATLAPGAQYEGTNKPVQLVCRQGHRCNPRPYAVDAGQGICVACAGQDRATVEAAFWSRAAELGATPIEGAAYVGKDIPVEMICAQGHRCQPRPSGLRDGEGLCRQCIVTFDRVYLLSYPLGAIKIGIASGPRRVGVHLRSGYQLVDQWQSLDHVRAAEVERLTIKWWRSQGWPQVNATPKDGRTETCSDEHLEATLGFLSSQGLDGHQLYGPRTSA